MTFGCALTSLINSARSGTVAKLYLYTPSDLDAVVRRPCAHQGRERGAVRRQNTDTTCTHLADMDHRMHGDVGLGQPRHGTGTTRKRDVSVGWEGKAEASVQPRTCELVAIVSVAATASLR